MAELSPTPDGRMPADASWILEGQLMEASNVVLRMLDDHADEDVEAPRAVYKPLRGERPLADFPYETLAHREVAMSLVAAAGGWDCVPETVWFDGELGPGSLQRWVGPLEPEEQSVVVLEDPEVLDALVPLTSSKHEVVDADTHASSPAWHPIAFFETDDGPAVLAHAEDERLREIAALDVVTNNADRKGSHVIEAGTRLFAIDNGLTFHVEDKLRTVLWGWAGEPLGASVEAKLKRLTAARERLTEGLRPHLAGSEVDALFARVDHLLAAGTFPDPPQDRYGLPWPPL